MLLSRQHGARLLARVANAQGRGVASLAEPVETASVPTMPPCEFTPLPYDGPSREEVLSLRKRFLSPGAMHATEQTVAALAQALNECFGVDLTRQSIFRSAVPPLQGAHHVGGGQAAVAFRRERPTLP